MKNTINVFSGESSEYLKKLSLRWLFSATLMSLLSSNAHAWDTSVNLSLLSHYRWWDGNTISNAPHIQWDITYTFNNWVNLGVWLSKDIWWKDGDEINYHIWYDKELWSLTIWGRFILADAPHVWKLVDVMNYYGYIKTWDTTMSTLVEDSMIWWKTWWWISVKQDISDNVSILLQWWEEKFNWNDYTLIRLTVSDDIFDYARFSIEPQYREWWNDEWFWIIWKLSYWF